MSCCLFFQLFCTFGKYHTIRSTLVNAISDRIIIRTIGPDSSESFENIFHFKILWVSNGKARLLLDNRNTAIAAGDFVILLPENNFQIKSFPAGTMTMLSLSVDYLQLDAKHFSIDLFKLFIQKSADKLLKTTESVFLKIETLKEIIFNTGTHTLVEQQIAINLLNTILLLLIQSNHHFVSFPDKYFERMHDFFILIFQNCKTEKRVTFYAGKLNISAKRLNQILLASTNRSASYFIQEHLVIEAKRHLLLGKLNITQIATDLGYDDGAYFSRFFKKWTGLSPEKYRKTIREGIV